tara:strand:- start:588 stop:2819 length:2232 start_codon:yes stop_codon:yes gene_type:complete
LKATVTAKGGGTETFTTIGAIQVLLVVRAKDDAALCNGAWVTFDAGGLSQGWAHQFGGGTTPGSVVFGGDQGDDMVAAYNADGFITLDIVWNCKSGPGFTQGCTTAQEAWVAGHGDTNWAFNVNGEGNLGMGARNLAIYKWAHGYLGAGRVGLCSHAQSGASGRLMQALTRFSSKALWQAVNFEGGPVQAYEVWECGYTGSAGALGAAPSWVAVKTAVGVPKTQRDCACTAGLGFTLASACTSNACNGGLNPCLFKDSVLLNGDLDLSSIHVGIFMGGADGSGATSGIQTYLQGNPATSHPGLTLAETYIRQGFCTSTSGTYDGADKTGRVCSEWPSESYSSTIAACPHDLATCDYTVSKARMIAKCDAPGVSASTKAPTKAPTPAAGTNTAPPLRLGFILHIEGGKEIAQPEKLSGHMDRTQAIISTLEAKGAKLSIELDKDFIFGVQAAGATEINKLKAWIASGHSIAIHADVGGQATDTVTSMKAFILTQIEALKNILGVETIHGISGICSHADWVQVASELDFTYITSIVEYCLKSYDTANFATDLAASKAPRTAAEYNACTNPSACHDAFPKELGCGLLPWAWKPSSTLRWLHVDASPGVSTLPYIMPAGMDTIKKIAEPAIDVSNADVDAFVARVTAIAAARWDGVTEATRTRVTSAQTVLSVGGSQEAAVLERMMDLIWPLVDSGDVIWSNLDETAAAYATQDAASPAIANCAADPAFAAGFLALTTAFVLARVLA